MPSGAAGRFIGIASMRIAVAPLAESAPPRSYLERSGLHRGPRHNLSRKDTT
jgi:hypothetical protein